MHDILLGGVGQQVPHRIHLRIITAPARLWGTRWRTAAIHDLHFAEAFCRRLVHVCSCCSCDAQSLHGADCLISAHAHAIAVHSDLFGFGTSDETNRRSAPGRSTDLKPTSSRAQPAAPGSELELGVSARMFGELRIRGWCRQSPILFLYCGILRCCGLQFHLSSGNVEHAPCISLTSACVTR